MIRLTDVSLPNTKNLFENRTFCIVGRFEGNPSENDLLDFIQSNGGSVVKEVDPSLDFLIVGKGKKSNKQKVAERLNAAGWEVIKIITNPGKLLYCFCVPLEKLATTTQGLKLLSPLTNKYRWLIDQDYPIISKQEFIKAIVAPKKNLKVSVPFQECSFHDCQFKNVEFYHYSPRTGERGWPLVGCKFKRVEFGDVRILKAADCTFVELNSWQLRTEILFGCNFSNSRLRLIKVGELTQVRMSDTLVNRLEPDWLYLNVTGSYFNNSKIEEVNSHSFQATDSKFEELNIAKAKVKYLGFENCQFVGCRFDSAKINQIEFSNCTFQDCTFSRIENEVLTIRDCEFEMVSFSESKFKAIHSDLETLKKIEGLPRDCLVDHSSLSKLFAFLSLCMEQNHFVIELEVTMVGGKRAAIEIERGFCEFHNYEKLEFRYCGINTSWRHYNEIQFPVSRAQADIENCCQDFLWIIDHSKAETPLFETFRLKTGDGFCNLKDFQKEAFSAFYFTFFRSDLSDEELSGLIQQSESGLANRKSIFISNLQAGNVETINRLNSRYLVDVCPIKNQNFSGANLEKIRLSKSNFENSDFSNVNFKDSNITKSHWNLCNFDNADLSKTTWIETSSKKTSFVGSNFENSKIKSSSFQFSNLNKANLAGSKIDSVDFSHGSFHQTSFANSFFGGEMGVCNFRGVDFSTAEFLGAHFSDCIIDQQTKMPTTLSVSQWKELTWEGSGIPTFWGQVPGDLEKMTFSELLVQIRNLFEPTLIEQAFNLLETIPLCLFYQMTYESISGAISSTSNNYSPNYCFVDSNGNVACCHETETPCGGSFGKICKHLLAFMTGLTKLGQIPPEICYHFLDQEFAEVSILPKNRISRIGYRHRRTLMGLDEWISVETDPKDFF